MSIADVSLNQRSSSLPLASGHQKGATSSSAHRRKKMYNQKDSINITNGP